MQENKLKEIDLYTYESRQKIYEEAINSFLECKPFEINGKTCDKLIDVMEEDVKYLCSCLEDVKEVITEGEDGKQHNEFKVVNTPLNIQLAKTINLVNQRMADARKLNVELGKQMRQLLAKNKSLQTKLKSQGEENGFGDEELLNEVENTFNEMTNILNSFVNNDTIAITLVEYRNQWLQEHKYK